MKILRTVAEVNEWKKAKKNIGFVPTMGALHEGHLNLVRESLNQCEDTVVSIFVNPTQFNNPNDLQTYPRTIEKDIELLNELGTDAVFLPEAEEIYSDGYQYKVCESKDSLPLEGEHRPGHFDGVLSVVMKLLMITGCHKCFMGEKDYQQLMLIQGMAKNLFLPVEVIGVPTAREADGLAMSSRNLNLSEEAREKAPLLYKVLKSETPLPEARKQLEEAGFKVNYLKEMWGRKLVAAEIGGVRLIDNV